MFGNSYVLGYTKLTWVDCVLVYEALQFSLLTGYSWDQPQGSQYTEGSKGFNVKSTWFSPMSVHWRMVSISFAFRLLLFGQKLQDNTEESVRKQRKNLTLLVRQGKHAVQHTITGLRLNYHILYAPEVPYLISEELK